MKQIDKHLEPNLYPNETDPNAKKLESYLLTFLIFVGIIGTFCVSNSALKSRINTSKTSSITSNVAESSETTNGQKNIASQSTLLISGPKETKESLFFTITNFKKKAQYELHLGNGMVIYPSKKRIAYSYPREGKYKVKLLVRNGDKVESLYAKPLTIAPAIPVIEGAYEEQ